MISLYKWTLFLLVLLCLFSCRSSLFFKEKTIEKYSRKGHWSMHYINLKDKQLFTDVQRVSFFSNKYYGTYKKSNDTIFLNYLGDIPNDRLHYLIKKDSSVLYFDIYKRIKKKYANVIRDSLNLIPDEDLMVKDTASLEFWSEK